jgi:hypothetical protein
MISNFSITSRYNNKKEKRLMIIAIKANPSIA